MEMKKSKKGRRGASYFLLSLLFFLLMRVSSWLCSLPMWVTLILHFTSSLSIKWFWATLAAWLLAGIIRYAMISFGRWGGSEAEPEKENKNPYSAK